MEGEERHRGEARSGLHAAVGVGGGALPWGGRIQPPRHRIRPPRRYRSWRERNAAVGRPDPASTPLPELKGRSTAVGRGPSPPLACAARVARTAAASPAPGSSGEGEEEPGSGLPATGSGFPAAGSGLLARIA